MEDLFAAIYGRAATGGQGEPSALDAQEAACRAYARQHSLSGQGHSHPYDHPRTGRTRGRGGRATRK